MAVAASTPKGPSILTRIGSAGHVWVAAASVILIILMIVPVAPWVIDLLLSVNITLALIIMLTTLYTENALAQPWAVDR